MYHKCCLITFHVPCHKTHSGKAEGGFLYFTGWGVHIKINLQGLEHMKMPYIHASIYNDHKCKYIFINSIMCTLIIMCIAQIIKYKLQPLWYIIVMCIIWLYIAFVNTLIEILNRRNPGEVITNFSDLTAVDSLY